MPYVPVLATRFSSTYVINSGAAIDIQSTITWPSLTVTLGNEGSVDEPPTRSYVNVVNIAFGGELALLLPLSNESIFVQSPLSGDGLRCSVKWLDRIRRTF